jgi:hypothetical protein
MNAHTAQILSAATSVAFVALGAYHFRRGVTLARKGRFPFRRKLFGSLSMTLGIAWGAHWIWAGCEVPPEDQTGARAGDPGAFQRQRAPRDDGS